ncbi:hypothetical protein [Lysobacter gummosus]|uniref:hypothetical protein n=1 Tax=Lysobacter gummosus TaxID=262324 RepID=UPI00362E5A97
MSVGSGGQMPKSPSKDGLPCGRSQPARSLCQAPAALSSAIKRSRARTHHASRTGPHDAQRDCLGSRPAATAPR